MTLCKSFIINYSEELVQHIDELDDLDIIVKLDENNITELFIGEGLRYISI